MPNTAPVSPASSNAKGELIAACRNQGLGDPSFESVSDGPGHAPWFRTTVLLGERELGRGEGRSKRDAERAASMDALRALSPAPELPGPALPGPELPAPESQTEFRPETRKVTSALPPERWPIYADVLSQALLVAHERNEDGGLPEVARQAAELYRRLLAELGHSPEQP